MLQAIGVLLLLSGVSAFMIGLIRYFFPSTERFLPDDMKRWFSLKFSIVYFLVGMVILRFF